MMRANAFLALVLLATACGKPVSPEGTAAQDSRDIAMVEAAQKRHAPPKMLAPEAITFSDIEQHKLSDARCAFIPDSRAGGDPVVLVGSVRGYIKLDGQIVTLAADTGSQEFPFGSREKYTGMTHWLQLMKAPEVAEAASDEAVRQPGWVAIRDAFDRAVYFASGTLICGDAALPVNPLAGG